MWAPTPEQRRVLASSGIGALAMALWGSFIGPVSVVSSELPQGFTLQLQLLLGTAVASAFLIVVAAWRSPRVSGLHLGIVGLAILSVGIEVGFGIWVPIGPGASYDPYGVQGSILLLWGGSLGGFTLLSSQVRRGRLPLAARNRPNKSPV